MRDLDPFQNPAGALAVRRQWYQLPVYHVLLIGTLLTSVPYCVRHDYDWRGRPAWLLGGVDRLPDPISGGIRFLAIVAITHVGVLGWTVGLTIVNRLGAQPARDLPVMFQ